jgi:hypothetical protein
MMDAVKAAYLCGNADGPRSFVSLAWAARGTVPADACASSAVIGSDHIESLHHARDCPAHPRLSLRQDVDGRDKHGHDAERGST